MLALGNFLLPSVLTWAWGYDGFVIVHLLCRAGCVAVGGGIGLGEYGKCIMHFGFGFEVNNPFVIIVLSILWHPHALSIIS